MNQGRSYRGRVGRNAPLPLEILSFLNKVTEKNMQISRSGELRPPLLWTLSYAPAMNHVLFCQMNETSGGASGDCGGHPSPLPFDDSFLRFQEKV
jgi:hypothetical protein